MKTTIKNLAGNSFEYDYGSYTYRLDFKSDTSLHWKCTKGDEKGKEGDETYATQLLGDGSFLIAWVESDGLGVSQVLNLEAMTIHCFLKMDKEIIPLSGTVKRL